MYTSPHTGQGTQAIDIALGTSVQSGRLWWDLAYQWTQDSLNTRYQSLSGKLRYPFREDGSGGLSLQLAGGTPGTQDTDVWSARMQVEQRF